MPIKHVTSHSQYVVPTIRLDSHIASNTLGNWESISQNWNLLEKLNGKVIGLWFGQKNVICKIGQCSINDGH